MKIKELLWQIEPDVYSLYRTLHENPELGMQEYCTSARVEGMLRKPGLCDEILHIGETGLLAVLREKKPGTGKSLLLRGDMDALPVTEDPDHDPRSRNEGVMHACGHDAHTAILLGTLQLLKAYQENFAGSIFFYFQPAEETLGGAKLLLETDQIDLNEIGGVAACHVMPDLYGGEIGLKYGAIQAGVDQFTITVEGRGGHGAHPYTTVDPVATAVQIVNQLQYLVSREVSALDSAVVSVCSIHSDGDAFNVIPDRVSMKGTLRALKKETRDHLRKRLSQIAEGVAQTNRASARVELTEGPPPLENDDVWVERAKLSAGRLIGPENVILLESGTMGAEDFAYIRERYPGVFVRIGCRSEGKEFTPIHSGRFRVDRKALSTGMLTLGGIALDYLGVDEQIYL